MLDGVLVDYFIIIQHIMLSFYWKKLDRQQHIQVFFEPFVKNINLTSTNYYCLIFMILIFYKSCGPRMRINW